MHEKEERLFIPRGMKAEKEWYEGFGKRELVHAGIGTGAILIVVLVIYLVTSQISYVVVALLFGETGVLAMVTRSPVTNLSSLDHILLALGYWREQQHYLYKQLKEE